MKHLSPYEKGLVLISVDSDKTTVTKTGLTTKSMKYVAKVDIQVRQKGEENRTITVRACEGTKIEALKTLMFMVVLKTNEIHREGK